MKEIPNLDELLNSYIDGELTARQHTEVQRLVAHDEKIAQQLEQLRKCKLLVSSMPVAEAPSRILEDVKASLARRTLLGAQPSFVDERSGARHLLGRRVFAAAAMLGLVAVLTAVIYSILAPETVTQRPVVIEPRDIQPRIKVPEPKPAIVAAPFSGRLELRTNYMPAVVSIINKAIEENIPSNEWIASERSNTREPHALICSTESFNLLLAELDNIWDKLDSASLFLDTEVFSEPVVVDAVTAEQIVGIVNQGDSKRRIEVAKDFAVLNNIAERIPGREILTAMDDISVGLIRPPKPVLTSNQKTIKKTTAGAGSNQNIRLTITVMAGN
jgi:hypothetical protein